MLNSLSDFGCHLKLIHYFHDKHTWSTRRSCQDYSIQQVHLNLSHLALLQCISTNFCKHDELYLWTGSSTWGVHSGVLMVDYCQNWAAICRPNEIFGWYQHVMPINDWVTTSMSNMYSITDSKLFVLSKGIHLRIFSCAHPLSIKDGVSPCLSHRFLLISLLIVSRFSITDSVSPLRLA